MISYNYTLKNQGLDVQVNCTYDSQSPINIFPFPGDTTNLLIQYNGTCNGAGETNVLPNNTQYMALNSSNGLAFWACKSPPSQVEPSYFIYLRGLQDYATEIGNITCNISPIQPAIFHVTYQSANGYFNMSDRLTRNPTTFSGFLDQSVAAIGNLVAEGQSQRANLVAESAFTFGVEYVGLPLTGDDPLYPVIYEVMIQGIMEYLVRYSV